LRPPLLQVARASPYVATPHRCSGLMLANHTSIRHLLDRTLRHYDKLMERKVLLLTNRRAHNSAPPSHAEG
jgi:tubulin gamma